MRPVYVFIPGMCHTAEFLDEVTEHMNSLGTKATALTLPTVGRKVQESPECDEVTYIRAEISDILETGSDVVLVCHSYSGIPGSRAVVGLDRETRLKAGKSSGIVEIVFIACLLTRANTGLPNNDKPVDWMIVDDGRSFFNDSGARLLFSDMDEEKQRYWYSKCDWHSTDPVLSNDPGTPWHLSIPKTAIVTTLDQIMPVEFQFSMISKVMEERPDTWTIKSIAAGHEPFLSQPENLTKLLLSSPI